MPKADIARIQTDKILGTMERRIAATYRQAEAEVTKKMDDYLAAFASKDERKLEQVADGVITEAEYKRWRTGQIAMGKRWGEMKETLAEDFHNANVIARGIIDGNVANIYALNHNYATFEVEKGALVDTSYTLYDRDTVTRLMRDDPTLLPPPGKKVSARIAAGEDVLWNRQQIQSVMTQSIIQGESITEIANRLATAVGDSNHKAAVRNARTMTTGAECAGRVDGLKRAQDMGIKTRQMWVATLDSRTRDSHREMDGEVVDVGEVFSNGCRFPGDPSGDPGEVYNCRCTIIAQVQGFERDIKDLDLRPNNKLEDMTYNEWLKAHGASEDILKPEKIADKMRKAYAAEYRMGEPAKQRTANPTNIFGETISYSEKLNGEKWDEAKSLVSEMTTEYNTKLKEVRPGAHQSAGSVQISGTVMNISSSAPNVVIHEFAHTISLQNQTKYGLYDEAAFWKEIQAVQREYKKAVGQNTARWISAYEHSAKGADEFMAEAFTLATLAEKGLKIPAKYGSDLTYANKVLDIVKKHFGKKK